MVILLLFVIYNFGFPKRQVHLLLKEDETVGIEDYWEAEVTVIDEHADTLFPKQSLNKLNPNIIYSTRNKGYVKLVIQFLAGDFSTMDTTVLLKDSIVVPISRAYGKKVYEGKVITGMGSRQPLNNAIVIIGNQIAKTNRKGRFKVYVDKSDISDDGTIKILKSGYKLLDTHIKTTSSYKLMPEDSLMFKKRLAFVNEKMEKTKYLLRGYLGKINGTYIEASIDKDSIFGYYYYSKIYKKEEVKDNALVIFTGKLNKNKSFHLDCIDDAYNLQELNGKINKDGSWEGYWHSYSTNLVKFKFNKIK